GAAMIRREYLLVLMGLLVPVGLGCKREPEPTPPSPVASGPGTGAGGGGGGGERRRSPVQGPPVELGQAVGTSGPQPVLWLQPSDLATATGDTPIRILVQNAGAPVDSSVLLSIAKAAQLRTYPDLIIVPTTTTTFTPPEVQVPKYNPDKET